MFTLDSKTGSITIDFTIPLAEAPDAEPEVVRVVVSQPPTVGAYKRLRAEIDTINRARDQKMTELAKDEEMGPGETTSKLNAFTEDRLLDWWKLVMLGDDTYRGHATPAPPADTDLWPVYLTTNESMQHALAHWRGVPLVLGEQPEPVTS